MTAPNGKLVSVFGDTFSGAKVDAGDWRSPVILIGTGDAARRIRYERAAGADPDYARQLWHYIHRDPATRRVRRPISTVIPSDLLRVDQTLYLHAMVNRGLGNVVWTEIWRSDDGPDSTALRRVSAARFPTGPHRRSGPAGFAAEHRGRLAIPGDAVSGHAARHQPNRLRQGPGFRAGSMPATCAIWAPATSATASARHEAV